MFDKINGKVLATAFALVMAITMIPASNVVETQAASKNKALQVEADFIEGAKNKSDSSVSVDYLVTDTGVTFGKTYSANMKLYVPAAFMKGGSLWVRPYVMFFIGDDEVDIGASTASGDGYFFDVNSKEVTKYNDYYVIDAKMPMTECEVYEGKVDYPEGKGKLALGVVINASGKNYKGSIYIDDVELVMDNAVVASADYDKNGSAPLSVTNGIFNFKQTKIVDFTGKSFEVIQTNLKVKKGKTVKIKADAAQETKITYKTSNKKIATVTNKGVVKGIKKGKATITVKANGKTVKVKVSVK